MLHKTTFVSFSSLFLFAAVILVTLREREPLWPCFLYLKAALSFLKGRRGFAKSFMGKRKGCFVKNALWWMINCVYGCISLLINNAEDFKFRGSFLRAADTDEGACSQWCHGSCWTHSECSQCPQCKWSGGSSSGAHFHRQCWFSETHCRWITWPVSSMRPLQAQE